MMKFPYWVRHNGVDYAPGCEVPMDTKQEVVMPETVKTFSDSKEAEVKDPVAPKRGRKPKQ